MTTSPPLGSDMEQVKLGHALKLRVASTLIYITLAPDPTIKQLHIHRPVQMGSSFGNAVTAPKNQSKEKPAQARSVTDK